MGSKPSRSARASRLTESALELLRDFQTVLIVDDSRSMKGELWKQTAEEVEDVFNKVTPTNSTPMGRKLQSLLEPYLAALKSNPNLKRVNYIVITDGAPTDRAETEPELVIVNAARELDSRHASFSQVGIQFVQIGGNTAATRYLESLDNSLRTKYNIRDIVDTTLVPVGKPLDMIKILTGGINRRVDDHGSKGL
ncbi:von willebrand factor [Mycena venus]|uniref:von willebrand factor n=1 Tax=Mycena venus TaxID=2733690 RepID=A0A8H7CWA7_9AGAR|nr:von willebrand factor [Mycena venus]